MAFLSLSRNEYLKHEKKLLNIFDTIKVVESHDDFISNRVTVKLESKEYSLYLEDGKWLTALYESSYHTSPIRSIVVDSFTEIRLMEIYFNGKYYDASLNKFF